MSWKINKSFKFLSYGLIAVIWINQQQNHILPLYNKKISRIMRLCLPTGLAQPKKMCIPNSCLFINSRAAMKEVICRVGSMEDIETVTSRVNSRQTSRATSRASSIIKLRKNSSNVGETSKFINPSPRKNSQDQSTDLWNFSLNKTCTYLICI